MDSYTVTLAKNVTYETWEDGKVTIPAGTKVHANLPLGAKNFILPLPYEATKRTRRLSESHIADSFWNA